jgi:hypothetical protein
MGWMAGVWFLAEERDFSLLHSMCTGSVPRGKAAGVEADHPPPSSAEVKNGGAVPPHPHTASWYSA